MMWLGSDQPFATGLKSLMCSGMCCLKMLALRHIRAWMDQQTGSFISIYCEKKDN